MSDWSTFRFLEATPSEWAMVAWLFAISAIGPRILRIGDVIGRAIWKD
jgi:hypothetical protein